MGTKRLKIEGIGVVGMMGGLPATLSSSNNNLDSKVQPKRHWAVDMCVGEGIQGGLFRSLSVVVAWAVCKPGKSFSESRCHGVEDEPGFCDERLA